MTIASNDIYELCIGIHHLVNDETHQKRLLICMTKKNEWIRESYVYWSNLEVTSSQMTRGLANLLHQIVLSSRYFLSSKCIKYQLRTEMMV